MQSTRAELNNWRYFEAKYFLEIKNETKKLASHLSAKSQGDEFP